MNNKVYKTPEVLVIGELGKNKGIENISPTEIWRIIKEIINRKVLIITTTDEERREIKDMLVNCILHTKLRGMLDRRNYRYYIYVSGLESICIMDYETWTCVCYQQTYSRKVAKNRAVVDNDSLRFIKCAFLLHIFLRS